MGIIPVRAATYSRVSTAHHGQKPELQTEELRRYCSGRGWDLAPEHEIVDHGFSGASEQRPGLKTLMGLVRSRRVDVVVVLKLDRLFRSLKHLVATLEEFQALGCAFVAVSDHVDYTTPSGRLFVQVLGALAEFEKALLVERTRLGLEHARRKGKRLGRPRIRDDAQILALRAQGLSYSSISRQLGVSRGAVYRACRNIKTGVSKTPLNVDTQAPDLKGGRDE